MANSLILDQINKILPADAKEQIEIANKIILNAYTVKVKVLEDEISKQMDTITARNNTIRQLEKRIQGLEMELADLTEKNVAGVEEQTKLGHEKQALIETVKRLNREVVKLEQFKKSLLSQLQDDGGEHGDEADEQSAVVHDVEGQRLVEGVLRGVASMNVRSPDNQQSGHTASSGGAAPADGAGDDGKTPLIASKVDGKEFFKGARARLSYEQFSAFLTVIKELNAGKATRDEALAQARAIFGEQNEDLYDAFENMLSRHMSLT